MVPPAAGRLVGLLLTCGLASGMRGDTDGSASEREAVGRRMSASEALAAGLISIDHGDAAGPGALAQVAAGAGQAADDDAGANDTAGTAKSAYCPEVKLCQQEGSCDVRNLAVITCVEAKNLPSQFMDKVDPYVKFWVEDKDNRASTTSFNNNEDPIYHWGCPFAYDGALNFDGAVYDDDFGTDQKVGDIASTGGMRIDAAFMQKADRYGNGHFTIDVPLFNNGRVVENKKGEKSTVKFKFEILRDPSQYKLVSQDHDDDPWQ